MQVAARLATTGDVLFSSKYSTVSDLRVWELRLHLCQAVKSTKYFSWMLFLHHKLIDDIAMVAGYVGDSGEQPIVFQTVQRGLRPPTDEERWAIIDCIDVHHRSHLWNIMSRGIHMTSTLPRGTARESTLVRAIATDYPPVFDEGPL